MCGMQNQNDKEALIEALRPTLDAIASLKQTAHTQCLSELQYILENKVTESRRIETLFDKLLDFFDDEDFAELFWALMGYVEQFDSGISSFYRRMEELLHEGE